MPAALHDVSYSTTVGAPVAGYDAWYDASDLSTITDAGAGACSQWSDKGPNGYHLTQGTGANRPTTGTRTINGRNVLDFDGSNDFMTSSLPMDDLSSCKFAVGIVDSVADNRTMLGPSAANGNEFRMEITTGNLGSDKDNVAVLLSGPAVRVGVAQVWAQQLSASDVVHWVDLGKIARATHATTFTGGLTLRVGYRHTSAFPYDGVIGEIISYPTTLSDADVLLTLQYLKGKWGT